MLLPRVNTAVELTTTSLHTQRVGPGYAISFTLDKICLGFGVPRTVIFLDDDNCAISIAANAYI